MMDAEDLEQFTRDTAFFTDVLRAWLRARREPPPVQAGALVYELTALLAREAESIEQADMMIEWWTQNMKEQIRALGVGVEHP
jgi:hypothetical protein